MKEKRLDLDYQNLFAAIERTLAMIVFDAQGEILWANNKFSQVIGYRVTELTDMHHQSLCLDTFSNSTDYVNFWASLRRNQAFHDKVERVKKDGSILWLDAMYTPVVNAAGKVESIIKIASDITNQETLLRDSSNEFMALVEDMTASTEEDHLTAEQIAEEMNQLNNESMVVKNNIEQIEDIASAVKLISSRSKVLGLNASIEAARAGEQGRGFSVVAKEIQKMATNSNDSVEDIE